MFKNVMSRFALRAIVAGVLAGLASLKASIGDGLSNEEVVDIVLATVGAAAAWAGLGAAIPQMEPNVGNKMEG